MIRRIWRALPPGSSQAPPARGGRTARRIFQRVPLLLLALPATVAAQEVRTTLAPDTVFVGDVFHVGFRVDVPSGYRAAFPDSLLVLGDVESTGRPDRTAEPLPGGGQRVIVTYPMTAWRPGPIEFPDIVLRLQRGSETRVLEAKPPRLVVASVLPADTAGIRPRPARGVVGPNWVLWPFLLVALLALLALAALAYWLRRRRRAQPAPVIQEAPPRERALAALERARELGLVEKREFKLFYSLVTEALRRYVAALEPAWGADLTTSELRERMAAVVDAPAAAELDPILRAADLVKFARRIPRTDEVWAEWRAARAFVERFDWRGTAEPVAADILVRDAEVA